MTTGKYFPIRNSAESLTLIIIIRRNKRMFETNHLVIKLAPVLVLSCKNIMLTNSLIEMPLVIKNPIYYDGTILKLFNVNTSFKGFSPFPIQTIGKKEVISYRRSMHHGINNFVFEGLIFSIKTLGVTRYYSFYHPYQLKHDISRDVQGLHRCRWYKQLYHVCPPVIPLTRIAQMFLLH